jgi:hypothetical protein
VRNPQITVLESNNFRLQSLNYMGGMPLYRMKCAQAQENGYSDQFALAWKDSRRDRMHEKCGCK